MGLIFSQVVRPGLPNVPMLIENCGNSGQRLATAHRGRAPQLRSAWPAGTRWARTGIGIGHAAAARKRSGAGGEPDRTAGQGRRSGPELPRRPARGGTAPASSGAFYLTRKSDPVLTTSLSAVRATMRYR